MLGCQGNPYKQLWGRLPTRLPPGRWARRGSGEGKTEVGDHAGFGCWAPNLCAPHSREVAWVVPCGRGDQSPVPDLSRAPRSHVTYTYKTPGTQAKSLVKFGVYMMKSQDIDGPCGGSLQWSLSCGRLWKGFSGPSHISGGEGQPAGSWHHAHQLPPGGQEVQGATKEAETWEGTLGPESPGTVPCDPTSLGSKAALPELVNENWLGSFSLGVCASCEGPAVP